jgi:photosystem II stability/assembly factor-like uncharacterized protein
MKDPLAVPPTTRFRSLAGAIAVPWLVLALVLPAIATIPARAAQPRSDPVPVPIWSNHGPYGGRVVGLAADPSAPGTFYASMDRGVFATTDGGNRWHWAGQGIPRSAFMGPVAVAPEPSRAVFAATEDRVYKSTDGGASWTAASRGIKDKRVYCFAVDPVVPRTVYVGTSTGEVYKSTTGGESWVRRSHGLDASSIQRIAVDPSDHQTLYAAAYYGGVFKSVDGARTWTQLSGAPTAELRVVAVDPREPSRVFALVQDGDVYRSTDAGASWAALDVSPAYPSDLVVDGSSGAVYVGAVNGVEVSLDGGDTWTRSDRGLYTAYVNRLAIDPGNGAVLAGMYFDGVYASAGGTSPWHFAGDGLAGLDVPSVAANSAGVVAAGSDFDPFVSRDGGDHWTLAKHGIGRNGISAVAFDPTSLDTLWAGASGGGSIFRSSDAGRTWSAQSVNDYSWIESISVAPSSPNVVYAGTMGDGVYRTDDGGASWRRVGLWGPDVTAVAVDADDPDAAWASADGFFGSHGGVYRTTDGGGHWQWLRPAGRFVTDLVVDPFDPQALVAGSYEGVRRTTDGGETWTKGSGISETVLALAADPAAPGVFFAGTYGGVYRSDDGGATWSPFNGPGLRDHQVQSLAVDPGGSILFAGTVFGGLFQTHL